MTDFTPEEVIQVIKDGRKCAGADLRDIDLREADLRGAKYNAGTEWPARFDPVAAGPGLVDGFPAGGGCIV